MRSKTLLHLILASLFLFQGINSHAQKDKGFNFPPGFGRTETLVVIGPVGSKKVTEAVIDGFEKEYKGKFERTEDRYGKNARRNDSISVYVLTVMEMPSAIRNTSGYKFGLIDLKTGKQYECDFWSGGYKQGAKYYAKHLEEFRVANGGK